MNREPLALITL